MSDIRQFSPLWGIWEIESPLGGGSFGDVWKVRREDVGGRVYYAAVKHISIPRDESEIQHLMDEGAVNTGEEAAQYYNHMLQSLLDEIDAMYTLQGYTNIVSYEDHKIIEKEGGIGYDLLLRMELLTPLTEKITDWKRQGGLTIQDVVRLGKDIATAIDVLNCHHLVHRDIKPQNIFINSKGFYKLGDYGTARVLKSSATAMSRKGTPNYMAPELYLNQPSGSQVDIYSCGMVMYRLVNGDRLPFLPKTGSINSDIYEEALRIRISGKPIPPPQYGDAELSRIILKACEYRPEDRYKNARELIADLENYQIPENAVIGGGKEKEKSEPSYGFHFGSSSGDHGNDGKHDERKSEGSENKENPVDKSNGGNDRIQVKLEIENSEETVIESEPGSEPKNPKTSDNTEPPASGSQPGVQKKKNKTLLIVALILAALLIAGGILVYGAGTKKKPTFEITWAIENESETTTVAYKELPNHTDPVKESDEQYIYTFAGWSPEIKEATADVTYKATFKKELKTYTITWQDDEGNTIETASVPYGSKPTHKEPVKEPDQQYDYSFVKWEPDIEDATGDATYKAIFEKELRTYIITWQDDEGNIIDTASVPFGTEPTHTDPTKESDQQYTYTFSGWQPAVEKVTEDATYKATFKIEPNVTPAPNWICSNCEKENSNEDLFCINCGTSRDASEQTATASQEDNLQSEVRSYTITWQDDEGNTIETTSVLHGNKPAHTDPVKEPDQQYVYSFVKWEPAIEDATGDATYKAIFEKELRAYTITWQDDEGNIIDTASVPFGTEPTHADPTKASDQQYTYTFSGWQPDVEKVTGDATYKATFKEETRSYTIIWQDDAGKTIDTSNAAYGTKPSHSVPTKDADEQYTYTFSGWQPDIKIVTGDATYKATFKKEKIVTPKPNWICSNCGKENPDEDSFCTDCGIPRESSEQDASISNNPVENGSKWICDNCKAENSFDDLFCTNCGQTKRCLECGHSVLKDDMFCTNCGIEIGKWKCSQCGNLSGTDDVFCTNCGTPRRSAEQPETISNSPVENGDTWICDHCEAENSFDNVFCTNCGQTKQCLECGHSVLKDDMFCTNCGTEFGKWKCLQCGNYSGTDDAFCVNCGTERHKPGLQQ